MSPLPKGTALVTGASSGIGEAFARRLAARGNDLLITARRAERLEALARELADAHGVSVRIVPADLGTVEGMEAVQEAARQAGDVAVLINNAGFGTTGAYHAVELEKQVAMIRVHVEAAARLVREVLPGMLERGAGAIVNLSSISSFLPAQNRTLYGATKAFHNYFSTALQQEVKSRGVRVQSLAPGFTYSDFHDREEFVGWSRDQVGEKLWMSSDEVARISLDELEKGRKTVVIPGWRNRLLVWAGNFPLTAWLVRWQQARRLKTPKGLE